MNCFDGSSFCGKCCYETEMPLTEEDIARIEALGYSRSDFTVRDGSIVRLRNVNGKCFFLDSENRCKIYQYRPKGCRIYPAVFDGKDVIADRFCPKWREVEVENVRRSLLQLIEKIYGKEFFEKKQT